MLIVAVREIFSSMELCCPLSSCFSFNPQVLPNLITTINTDWRSKNLKPKPKSHHVLQVSAVLSYKKFIDFALNQTKRHTILFPAPLQEKYSSMTAMDGRTELQMLSFQAPKIRLLRSLSIENEAMQVLDFAVFSRPEFDVPIFCANFFSTASMNIVVLNHPYVSFGIKQLDVLFLQLEPIAEAIGTWKLTLNHFRDLNPLHDVIDRRDYKEKYYESLMPLGLKYTELFPWGGKLTSESLKFFSPIVIWTKFTSSQYKHDGLYSAFTEYYKAWLELIDQAVEETDASQIICNHEAQHKYLTWRAEKDPGYGVLKRLIGERLAKDLVRNFLFNGIDELGSKGFLDYFPQYRCEDGTINEKRSIVGRSFETRPWDARGEFIGNSIEI